MNILITAKNSQDLKIQLGNLTGENIIQAHRSCWVNGKPTYRACGIDNNYIWDNAPTYLLNN